MLTLTEILDGLKDAYAKDIEKYDGLKLELANAWSAALSGMAVTSAAAAVGAMVLLGSSVDVKQLQIVIGIVLLLINTSLIYIFLFTDLSRADKNLANKRHLTLSRSAELLLASEEQRAGRITETEFRDKFRITALAIREEVIQNNRELIDKKPRPNHYDIPFILLFGLGILFISYGILYPQIFDAKFYSPTGIEGTTDCFKNATSSYSGGKG